MVRIIHAPFCLDAETRLYDSYTKMKGRGPPRAEFILILLDSLRNFPSTLVRFLVMSRDLDVLQRIFHGHSLLVLREPSISQLTYTSDYQS